MKTIKKSIDINASKQSVWDVLFQDKYTRVWYPIFAEGSYAETDWKVGSKILFKDSTGNGMVGRIIVNKPYDVLSLEYEGLLNSGIEDYASDEAELIKGGHETYSLSEKDGVTQLLIESDMSDDFFETMSSTWDEALKKINELAETT